MDAPEDLRAFNVNWLAHRCAAESNKFFHRAPHDPRYCFELFRRAIVEGDRRAWEHIYRQYENLVASWIRRHPSLEGTGEEIEYFVNRAFEKMWTALTPEKFAHFPNLKSLLRYLQMCAYTAVVDYARRRQHPEPEPLDQVTKIPHETSLEEHAVRQVDQDLLWRLIRSELKNQREVLVMRGLFISGLKPRELQANHPDVFASVEEVYLARQNVLSRLRRNQKLKSLIKS